MIYLITEIFIFLLIAAVLGFMLAWWLCGKKYKKLLKKQAASSYALSDDAGYNDNSSAEYVSESLSSDEGVPASFSSAEYVSETPSSDEGVSANLDSNKSEVEASETVSGAKPTLDDSRRPVALMSDASDGRKDNLEEIKGVGPKLHGVLNDLGIYTFQQIADFDRGNIEWVDEYLSFKGRIDRDEWVDQAKKLA